LQAKGKHDEAIKVFEEALRLNPQDAETHYKLGTLLYAHTTDTERAIYHIQEAAKLDPTLKNSLQKVEQ
jgi:tetratricopeptide (TPR) repeat protein